MLPVNPALLASTIQGGLMLMLASPQRRSVLRPAGLALALGTLFLVSGSAPADVPAQDRAKIVGLPTSLLVQPSAVTLTGPRSLQQLVVTGKYADGSVRALTPFAFVSFEQHCLVTLEAHLYLRHATSLTTCLALPDA